MILFLWMYVECDLPPHSNIIIVITLRIHIPTKPPTSMYWIEDLIYSKGEQWIPLGSQCLKVGSLSQNHARVFSHQFRYFNFHH